MDLPDTDLGEHPSSAARRILTPAEKAAVVMRLLLAEDAAPSLARLPGPQQERLAAAMARIGYVDRATLAACLRDFTRALDGYGIGFPRDLAGAADLLRDRLSADVARRLAEAQTRPPDDGIWGRLARRPTKDLVAVLTAESAEVGAVLLSKMPADAAATLLAEIPQERAELIAFAMAATAGIGTESVERIGEAMMARIDATPDDAFDAPAARRIAAVLDSARAQVRDDLLSAIERRDADLARAIRAAVFTPADIPARLDPLSVPPVLRTIPPGDLAVALAVAQRDVPEVATFLLDNMPRRLADQLREEAADVAVPDGAEAEAALGILVAAIRTEAAEGRISLRTGEA